MAKFWSCLLCEIITLGVRCHSQNWQILPKLLEIVRRCLLCEIFPSLSRCHSKDLAFLPKQLDCVSRSVLLKDWVKLNAIQTLKYNLIEIWKQYFWGLKSSVSYELREILVEGWGVVVLWWRQGGSNPLLSCLFTDQTCYTCPYTCPAFQNLLPKSKIYLPTS